MLPTLPVPGRRPLHLSGGVRRADVRGRPETEDALISFPTTPSDSAPFQSSAAYAPPVAIRLCVGGPVVPPLRGQGIAHVELAWLRYQATVSRIATSKEVLTAPKVAANLVVSRTKGCSNW